MGIQINYLSPGANIVSAQQEFPQEKRPPLPAEQIAAEKESGTSLPGFSDGKNQNLQKTTSELERISLAFDRRLKFIVDHESREILIKVIDNETDKVIKVLPPEELQRLHSRIRETIGFLFDTMV